MLKKIAKRITKEVEQAKDYIEQAYMIKYEHREVADLFITLASEEIVHAERLLKAGFNMIMTKDTDLYVMSENKPKDMTDSHFEKCKAIWDWENRLMGEEIAALKYKISNYKN